MDEPRQTWTARLLGLLGALALVVGLFVGIFGSVQILHDKGIGVRFSVGGGLAALGMVLLSLSGFFAAVRAGSWAEVNPFAQIVGIAFIVGGMTFAATSNLDYVIGSWGLSVIVLQALIFLGFIRPRT